MKQDDVVESGLPACGLADLPPDLLNAILRRCSSADLAAVACSSKALRAPALENELWQDAASAAFAWKLQLVGPIRSVLQAPPAWCQPRAWAMPHAPVAAAGGSRGSHALPHTTADAAWQVPPPLGVEWLLAKTGKRLRLLGVEIRHTAVGWAEMLFGTCLALIAAWGGNDGDTSQLCSRLASVARRWPQHTTKAVTIVCTLVADSLALHLRPLLTESTRSPAAAWQLLVAAHSRYSAWLETFQYVLRFSPSDELLQPDAGHTWMDAGAAAFRSQVLLAFPIRGVLQAASVAISNSCLKLDIWMEDKEPTAVAKCAPESPDHAADALQLRGDVSGIVKHMRQVPDVLRLWWWNNDIGTSRIPFKAAFGNITPATLV